MAIAGAEVAVAVVGHDIDRFPVVGLGQKLPQMVVGIGSHALHAVGHPGDPFLGVVLIAERSPVGQHNLAHQLGGGRRGQVVQSPVLLAHRSCQIPELPAQKAGAQRHRLPGLAPQAVGFGAGGDAPASGGQLHRAVPGLRMGIPHRHRLTAHRQQPLLCELSLPVVAIPQLGRQCPGNDEVILPEGHGVFRRPGELSLLIGISIFHPGCLVNGPDDISLPVVGVAVLFGQRIRPVIPLFGNHLPDGVVDSGHPVPIGIGDFFQPSAAGFVPIRHQRFRLPGNADGRRAPEGIVGQGIAQPVSPVDGGQIAEAAVGVAYPGQFAAVRRLAHHSHGAPFAIIGIGGAGAAAVGGLPDAGGGAVHGMVGVAAPGVRLPDAVGTGSVVAIGPVQRPVRPLGEGGLGEGIAEGVHRLRKGFRFLPVISGGGFFPGGCSAVPDLKIRLGQAGLQTVPNEADAVKIRRPRLIIVIAENGQGFNFQELLLGKLHRRLLPLGGVGGKVCRVGLRGAVGIANHCPQPEGRFRGAGAFPDRQAAALGPAGQRKGRPGVGGGAYRHHLPGAAGRRQRTGHLQRPGTLQRFLCRERHQSIAGGAEPIGLSQLKAPVAQPLPVGGAAAVLQLCGGKIHIGSALSGQHHTQLHRLRRGHRKGQAQPQIVLIGGGDPFAFRQQQPIGVLHP